MLIEKLTRSFIQLFGAINRNLIREPEDSVKATNPGQSALLFVLRKTGAANMSTLGKLLVVSKPNITFLVDRLEEKEMIRRVRNMADRRSITIELTDKGRQFVDEREAFVEGRIKRKLNKLEEKDLKNLENAVGIVLSILEKLYNPDNIGNSNEAEGN